MGSKGGPFSRPDLLLRLRLSTRYRSEEGDFIFFSAQGFLWGFHDHLKVVGIQLVFVVALRSFPGILRSSR